MDLRVRFADALADPSAARLDVAALCIAGHAHPGLDVDAGCARLDELAAACYDRTFGGVRRHLFEHEGFTGNSHDYGDPENSFLDSVLARRTGIPITLAIVMMEVGRRVGVAIDGVGMPGHFLVADATREGVWCDPFHGGAELALDGCRQVFERVHGHSMAFHESMLRPTPSNAIVARVLTNLEHGRLGRDPAHLRWLCELHLLVPGLGEADAARLRAALRTERARWN